MSLHTSNILHEDWPNSRISRPGRVEKWRGGLGWAYRLPALSVAGASLAQPCSVSTSRSSNRTCGFPASGSRTGFTTGHTLPGRHLRPTVKLLPEHLVVSEVARHKANRSTVVPSTSTPEPRPFRSTSVTSLHHYYEPLRHPDTARPVTSRSAGWSAHASTAGASRVASVLRLRACPHHYPGRIDRDGSLRRWAAFPLDIGLPSTLGGSAPALTVSGPARCSLA